MFSIAYKSHCSSHAIGQHCLSNSIIRAKHCYNQPSLLRGTSVYTFCFNIDFSLNSEYLNLFKMQFAQAIVLFATLSASAVSATPAQSGSKRQSDLAIVNMWSGDNCDGNQDTVHIQGSGAYRCVPVSGKRSIAAPEKRCVICLFPLSGTVRKSLV